MPCFNDLLQDRLYGSQGGKVNPILYKKGIHCLRGRSFTSLAIHWRLQERLSRPSLKDTNQDGNRQNKGSYLLDTWEVLE